MLLDLTKTMLARLNEQLPIWRLDMHAASEAPMILGYNEFESLLFTIVFYDGYCEIIYKNGEPYIIEYADPDWLTKFDNYAQIAARKGVGL